MKRRKTSGIEAEGINCRFDHGDDRKKGDHRGTEKEILGRQGD
jgi:hypothetical protein